MNITVRTLAGDLPLSGLDPAATVAHVLQALAGAARQAGIDELPSRLVNHLPSVCAAGPGDPCRYALTGRVRFCRYSRAELWGRTPCQPPASVMGTHW